MLAIKLQIYAHILTIGKPEELVRVDKAKCAVRLATNPVKDK